MRRAGLGGGRRRRLWGSTSRRRCRHSNTEVTEGRIMATITTSIGDRMFGAHLEVQVVQLVPRRFQLVVVLLAVEDI